MNVLIHKLCKIKLWKKLFAIELLTLTVTDPIFKLHEGSNGFRGSFKTSKMATSSATFPSLLPRVADNLWFTLEKKSDDDAALTKEEEEYAASVCLCVFEFLLLAHKSWY